MSEEDVIQIRQARNGAELALSEMEDWVPSANVLPDQVRQQWERAMSALRDLKATCDKLILPE